jgi:hypothetical protein
MPSDLPRNINHFQADLLKGFLNENLSTGSTSYPKLSAMELGGGQNRLVHRVYRVCGITSACAMT